MLHKNWQEYLYAENNKLAYNKLHDHFTKVFKTKFDNK